MQLKKKASMQPASTEKTGSGLQIEHQHFSAFGLVQADPALAFEQRSVTLEKWCAVDSNFAPHQMHVTLALRGQGQFCALISVEQSGVQTCVGMKGD
jgi:hypothetical protein